MNFTTTKNIIFDFGAVVINIDIPKAYQSFANLSNKSPEEVKNLFESQGAYAELESGKLSEKAFYDLLRKELETNSSDKELEDAWNSMLLDVPKERYERLIELKSSYSIFLLSNTNSIHVKRMKQIFKDSFGVEDFTKIFHIPFLSYEIGLIKPNPEIYTYVLKNAGIKKEETVFLDDNPDNVKSALSIGLPTIQVIPNSYTMMEILKNA